MRLIQYFQTIILFTNIVKSELLPQNIILFVNQTYRALSSGSFVFESNQKNFSEINSINQQLLKEAFTMEKFSNGKIIHLVFLHSINFQLEVAYCVCQLEEFQQSYFIVCIDGIKNFQSEVQLNYIKNAKKYHIVIQSEINEKCEKLFVDINSQLIVLCYTSNKLKIYRINLSRQSTILLKETEMFNSIDCQNKFINFDQFTILIFYNCKNWKLIKLAGNNLQTIMNKDLIKEIDQFNTEDIKLLTEIAFCQSLIYFIEFQNYYIFQFLEDNFHFTNQHTSQFTIKDILFSDYCEIVYQIVFDNLDNHSEISFLKNQSLVKINQKMNFEVYATNNYLFLRKDNNLRIIICQFLNQSYQIQLSKMNFIDYPIKLFQTKILFPNFFFQIDESQSTIIFYQYFDLPKLIKPTKKYLFSVYKFNILTDQNSYDFQIQEAQYRNYFQDKNVNFEIKTKNDCESINSVKISKLNSGMIGNSTIFLQSESNKYILSISDEQDFNYLFPFAKNMNLENLIHVDYYQKNLATIVFLQNNKIRLFSSNLDKLTYEISQEYSLIFYYDEFLVIVNLQLNCLEILMPLHNEYLLNIIKFNQSIINVTQSQSYLLIKFIDNTFCIYQFQSQIQIYLSNELLKYGIPTYYMQSSLQEVIFYDHYIIIKKKLQSRVTIIDDDVVVYDISLIYGIILIKTIHKLEDKIITFLFDGNQLLKDNEFVVQNSNFVRPLIFKSEKIFISIACLTNQIKTILTFFVKDYIYMVNLKHCHNFKFFLSSNYLIYFNSDNFLKIIDLNYLNITFKNPKQQINYFDSYEFEFQISIQDKNSTQLIQNKINILFFNFCYQIFTLNKVIPITNLEKINVETLFFGPIKLIQTKNENQLKIQGPIKLYQKIQNCQTLLQQSEYCVINFDIFFISTNKYFFFQYIQNLTYIISSQKNNKIKLLKYELISESSQFLNLIKINNSIFIQIFTIDLYKQEVKEIFFVQIKEINQTICELQAQSKNFLFLFSCKFDTGNVFFLLYYYEKQYQFYSMEETLLIFDICSIKNFNQQYVIILNKSHMLEGVQVELQIFLLENHKKQLILTIELDNEFYNELVKHEIYLIDFHHSNKNITKCIYFSDSIEINVFLIFVEFSFEVNIIYNKKTQQKQFKILRIIRNFFSVARPTMEYINSQILILKSLKEKLYLYNLKNDKSFYDYFGEVDQVQIIKQINTTHYLFESKYEYFIGQFGYEFELINESNQQIEKVILVAENQVSSSELEIILEEDVVQNKIKYYLILLFLILIFIYIIRRKKLIYHLQKNKQDNQVHRIIDINKSLNQETINTNQ